MKFTKDATKTGRINCIVGLIVITALICLQLLVFNKQDVSIAMSLVVWLVGLFVGLVFIHQGVSLLRSGGSWNIIVNEDGIDWSSPCESVDQSFKYQLSELQNTETNIIKKRGKSRVKWRYYLVTKTGEKQKLSVNSGIKLSKVIEELEKLGINNEITRT